MSYKEQLNLSNQTRYLEEIAQNTKRIADCLVRIASAQTAKNVKYGQEIDPELPDGELLLNSIKRN